MTTMNLKLYQRYLALDGLTKRFEAAGVEIDPFWGFDLEIGENCDTARPLFAGQIDSENAGEVAWADLKLHAMPLYPDEGKPLWQYSEEERQQARERALFALLERFPDGYVVRSSGTTYLYGLIGPMSYAINLGNALCKKVETGTREIVEPDPDLVAELPTVTRTEPVYEWRCDDPIEALDRLRTSGVTA